MRIAAGIARLLARLIVAVLVAGSLAATLWSAAEIAANPGLRPVMDRTASEIVAATDAMMASEATPERLADLMTRRLAENPRNWVALQALDAVVAERGIALPDATRAAYAAALTEDTSLSARATDCAVCIWDAGQCTLGTALLCQAPVALTPIGDIAGLARAGIAQATGAPIDRVDLALSIVGLGATALVLASGGTSAVIKAGAGTARLARRMDLLSPRLTGLIETAVRTGVDWTALRAARSADDLARAVRTEAFAPLIATAQDVGRMRASVGATDTLHLLARIDGPADARGLARAAEALGPRTVGRVEILGKARILRAGLRLSNTAWSLIAGIAGLATAAAGALGNALGTALLRGLRRGF